MLNALTDSLMHYKTVEEARHLIKKGKKKGIYKLDTTNALLVQNKLIIKYLEVITKQIQALQVVSPTTNVQQVQAT
ncbi:hypothetical protein CR513_18898, partial [Mucuna pruriens]